jgi:RecB family endonuclease NucS
VAGATAIPATPISLSEAGFTERNHLQEWVIAHPEMLGPGVMVVTLEFDHWRSAAGTHERDRLDVLGLDRDGRLVVAELKRDVAPDTVEMQALK